MEELSDDDVKNLASDWVKSIQTSLLTPGYDVRNSRVVTTCFGSSDERMHTNHEFREENGEIEFSNSILERPGLEHCSNRVRFKQFSVQTRASSDSKKHVPSFENTSEQSNVDRASNATDEKTPRPDADFLRQKRLAFFNRNQGGQNREALDLCRDRTHNTSEHDGTNQLPIVSDHKLGRHSSSSAKFDYSPTRYAREEITDDMYHLETLDTPASCSFNGAGTCSSFNNTGDLQYPPAQAFEADEEEMRLELWGLKEAVHSGQLNLNAYLKEPSWKATHYFSASSRQPGNNFCGQSGDLLSGDTCIGQPLNHEFNPAKISDSRNCNQPHLITVKDADREIRGEYDQHHMGDNHKKCSPVVAHVNEVANSTEFCGPEPQINGPLYSGFENSDSETSLLSFGSKCDDVHYRKVLKKQNVSSANEKVSPQGDSHSQNKKQQKFKVKQKRGKEKILLELTEFIEGCGSPKDWKQSKQNCGGNDFYLKHSSQAPTVNDVDISVTEDSEVHTTNQFLQRDDTKELNDNNKLSLVHEPIKEAMVPPSESSGNVFGKICPKCEEVNSKAANWCIECGTALICVKASCLTAHQRKVFEKQCKETQALIKETLKTPMNFSHLSAFDKVEEEERSLSNDISNLSLQVSQSTSYLEEEKYLSSPHGYKRRWLRSSIAWSTYHPSELAKSPSFVKNQGKLKKKQRATSFSDLTTCSSKGKDKGSKAHKTQGRSKSSRKRTVSCSSVGPDSEAMDTCEGFTNLKAFNHSQNTSVRCNQKQSQPSVTQIGSPLMKNQVQPSTTGLPKNSSFSSLDDRARPSESHTTKKIVPPLNLQDVGSYDRILTLIRSQRNSEPVPYLYLPDEILLQIFSFLPHKDLVSCSRVCSQFCRISMDETLWKVIVLKKNNNITDEWLCAIGKRHPVSLTISQCHSDKVTAKGLRDLFQNCSDSLEELDFSSCRGGELIGESVLLRVAARCCWLRSVDASWTNVSDVGVQALVDNVKMLECLCLNGCQAVSDKSIKCVASKHGKTLRIFEVFGCFNISPAGIEILGQTCKNLQTLNIGQCYKITDSAIGSLVSNLSELENLDLRGCKQVRDSAVKKIVRHCPLVTTLVLANCPLISDVSLAEIATNIPRIRSLDICGCSRVSDNGICALSRSCRRLELLDLTSTGVGHKSVMSLANYCSQSLCNLKLSFCTDISENTVVHLAKSCKRLTTLHLYGCKRIRNTSDLRLLNPTLTIEC